MWRVSPIALPALSVFFAVAFVFMMHIQPAAENPALLPPTHNHPTAAHREKLLGNMQVYPLAVDIYFGLAPRDDRGLDPSRDAEMEWSRTYIDDTFDMRSTAAQLHVLGICDQLLSSPGYVRNYPSIECPLYAWRDWLAQKGVSFPAPPGRVDDLLVEWSWQLSWPHSEPLVTSHPSPLTSHPSPLTHQAAAHLTSPLTPHPSPLTSHLSPLTSHLSPLTSHLSPLASHLSPLTSHLSPLTSRLHR